MVGGEQIAKQPGINTESTRQIMFDQVIVPAYDIRIPSTIFTFLRDTIGHESHTLLWYLRG